MTATEITNETRAPRSEAEGEPKVAYLLKAFARTSETFITNEIFLLESLGLPLRVYSMKRLENQKLHGNALRIRTNARYLPEAESLGESSFLSWLRETLPRFAGAHAQLFAKRPFAWLASFAECIGMCVAYREPGRRMPRKVFFKEFLQAGAVAHDIVANAPHIRHIHAHFCHGATTVAMFAARMSGRGFSFTAHAKDIYLKELNPGKLLRRKLRRARFSVTCTGANQHHLDQFRPEKAQLHTIYHGLDLSLFTPESAPACTEVPLLLSVGRIVEKKGFTDLVDACSILHRRGYRFQCRIVGGDGDASTAVRARIATHRLEGVVKMCPPVTQEELKRIYRDASLFVLPCQVMDNGDRDGIPNVLVEAMAMRLPVISTSISGIPELIKHEHNGLLVTQRHPVQLAEAMARLLDDKRLAARLSQAARSTVTESFDARRNTGRLLRLFEEAVR
ncbi:MAG: glycosyltransferase family 4 protein [Bryobacteraceae bacterium]